jgi:excinuclease ABC subunit A
VVAEGTPEDVAADPDSYTGQFLAKVLDGAPQPARRPAAKRGQKRRAG